MKPLAEQQWLVFRLDTREYALPLASIVEVQRMVAIAGVPHSPSWLSGLINLRGRVVPVIDLRVRLGLPAPPAGLSTPLIIGQSHARRLGLIVDSATEVLTIPSNAIEPPDRLAGDSHSLSGIARVGSRLIFLLDLEQLDSALPWAATALALPAA